MGMTEWAIIRLIRSMVGEPPPGVRVPLGDDAAGFHFTGGDALLTVDSIYEGVHFNLDSFNHSDVGWKAAAAAVSDIAAMGGEPACALLSIGLDTAPSEEEVRSLVSGVLMMLDYCNCALVGGDVCRSPAGLAVTVTVAGTPPQGGPLLRGGANVGDHIAVTGFLGDSAAGLLILEEDRKKLQSRFPRLVESHLRPRPRVQAGVLIAGAGARAMEDVSDGLGVDLGHICEESNTGCEIQESLIPLSEDMLAFAAESGVDPVRLALSGGEDFELLFTARQECFERALLTCGEYGTVVTRIGTVTEADRGCKMVTADGRNVDLGAGYEHFG